MRAVGGAGRVTAVSDLRGLFRADGPSDEQVRSHAHSDERNERRHLHRRQHDFEPSGVRPADAQKMLCRNSR
jgi:hypothetical protein